MQFNIQLIKVYGHTHFYHPYTLLQRATTTTIASKQIKFILSSFFVISEDNGVGGGAGEGCYPLLDFEI